MTDQAEHPRIDGRRARGERTRLNVLEALLALVDEGQLRPTAQEVAERAGVALRTVYHHFEDVEALRRLAFDLQVGRNREALRPLESNASVAERCRQVAHQLRRFYEAITPIRRAVLLEERGSAAMADVIRRSRGLRREFVEQAFAPEADRRDVPERRVMLDALDVITSWESWYYLRASLGRGAQAAERVLCFELERLFAASLAGSAGRRAMHSEPAEDYDASYASNGSNNGDEGGEAFGSTLTMTRATATRRRSGPRPRTVR